MHVLLYRYKFLKFALSNKHVRRKAYEIWILLYIHINGEEHVHKSRKTIYQKSPIFPAKVVSENSSSFGNRKSNVLAILRLFPWNSLIISPASMHSSTGGKFGHRSFIFVNPFILSKVPNVPRNLHLKIFCWLKDISTVTVDFEVFSIFTSISISVFSILSHDWLSFQYCTITEY